MRDNPCFGRSPGPDGVEAALREREDFLRSIGDNLPDGMIYQLVRETDGTRRFTYVSDAVRWLHGCTPEEALEDAGRVYATVHPEDRARVAREEEAAHASLSVFRTEARRVGPDGAVRWSQFASKPRRLPDGRTSWDGVEIDVSARKRVEAELRMREESYRQISRLMTEDVFRLDVGEDGNAELTIVSEGLFDTTGPLEAGARTPEHWSRIAHPDDREALLSLLRRLIAEGGKGEFEGRFARGDGSFRCVHAIVEAVREYPEARTTSILGAVQDVTARRRAERERQALQDELLAANAELAAALRLKDEFLSSMSHELRTPLNAILGTLQALREGVYGAPNERLLRAERIAEDAGRHLLELIGDILDLSKVQAGRLELETSPVPVRALCESSLNMVEKLAERKRIRLEFDHDPGVPTIVADGRRLRQILVNLLSNAVKFTPDGGCVRLAVSGDGGRGTVGFSVTDDGIGIPEEKLPLLFQPFTQVDSRLSRLHPGTGLGLPLVLGLATLHGGGIEVRSRPGEGSCFTVRLPWRTGGAPAGVPGKAGEGSGTVPGPSSAPAPARAMTFGGAVLVVEDNEAGALVLSDYLTYVGFEVTVAHSGLEALRITRATNPGVILMDIQMPGMDGLEAIRHLRAEGYRTPRPIVAVTALAMPGDRERCLSAGATDYLTKPLDLPALAALLGRLTGTAAGPGVQSCIVENNTRLHA